MGLVDDLSESVIEAGTAVVIVIVIAYAIGALIPSLKDAIANAISGGGKNVAKNVAAGTVTTGVSTAEGMAQGAVTAVAGAAGVDESTLDATGIFSAPFWQGVIRALLLAPVVPIKARIVSPPSLNAGVGVGLGLGDLEDNSG